MYSSYYFTQCIIAFFLRMRFLIIILSVNGILQSEASGAKQISPLQSAAQEIRTLKTLNEALINLQETIQETGYSGNYGELRKAVTALQTITENPIWKSMISSIDHVSESKGFNTIKATLCGNVPKTLAALAVIHQNRFSTVDAEEALGALSCR